MKFMEKMSKEHLRCNNCNIGIARYEEIKIHCTGCDKLNHCGVVEVVQVKMHKNLQMNNQPKYCNGCAKEVYSDGTCLCKSCSK